MSETSPPARQYGPASDFDQTSSFHNFGSLLSELLGVSGFQEKVSRLSHIHLVQEAGELADLLRHDSEYRRVRQAHLLEVGSWIRLKHYIKIYRIASSRRIWYNAL
jgi:hypothetical protein